MWFMRWIIEELSDISSWFYDIYLEVNSWVWPFWYAASAFYQLCILFNTLAWDFSDFSDWVTEVSSKIGDYLSWDTIWDYITSYVPNLIEIGNWFYNWSWHVWGVIDDWWSTVEGTVRGWIDAAVGGLKDIARVWSNFWNNLWPQLVSSFNSLESAWDNFWTVTFPNLVSFTWLGTWWNSRLLDVQGLINSNLKTWFPFYDDLVKIWSSIAAFFTDPVEFIWQRFTDWFLGPEG